MIMTNEKGDVINPPTGAEAMQAIASGSYNGKNFGVYASDDPTGAKRAAQYNVIKNEGIGAALAKFP